MAGESQGVPAAFGRYRVRERLGVGGMGAVYLARDEALERDVAVKVLRPLIAVGEPPADFIERFRREARAVALLTHANVVRVYDQGIEGDFPYLVMELITGPTLTHRLAQSGALEVREVRTLGIQIATALDAAHAAGIIHRDVKPSNVLQSGTGSWKLADFGIAHTNDSSLTITGQFLGTPAYAAPEALEGRAVGLAADLYSLGGTLYFALTGEPPYGDANLGQLILAIQKGQRPRSIAERRPDLPSGIAAALDRAMSLSPEMRPSAAELAHELAMHERVVTPVPGTLMTPAPTVAAARPVDRARLRRVLVIAGLVVGALALGLALGGGRDEKGATSGITQPQQQKPQKPPAVETRGEDQELADEQRAAMGPPPWTTEVPPELAYRQFGKGKGIEKRWRKAIEKLHEGEMDKGAEELHKILEEDPTNVTAQRWLAWMEMAARDPRQPTIQYWDGEEE